MLGHACWIGAPRRSRPARRRHAADTVIFFYEILFVVAALTAAFIGEVWSRTFALLFLLAWWGVAWLGYASFGARLARSDDLAEEERRWYRDAYDGLRHLRLLFGIASGVMLLWRLLGG